MRMGCLFSAVFLIVVAVLADLAVTKLVESAATEQLSARLDAPATVDVTGWPATLGLLRGTADARVTARKVALRNRDVIVDHLDVQLTDIRATIRSVKIRRGRLVATMKEQELGRLIRVPRDLPLDGVKVEPGRLRLQFKGVPDATAQVSVIDNTLVLQPSGPLLEGTDIPVPLDGLPLGVRVTDVRLRQGRVDVVGVVGDAALRRLEFPLFNR